MTYYWFSMLEYIYSTKIRNKTVEAPFCIPGARTERQNNLRVKKIVESKLCFCWNSTGTQVIKFDLVLSQSVLSW